MIIDQASIGLSYDIVPNSVSPWSNTAVSTSRPVALQLYLLQHHTHQRQTRLKHRQTGSIHYQYSLKGIPRHIPGAQARSGLVNSLLEPEQATQKKVAKRGGKGMGSVSELGPAPRL